MSFIPFLGLYLIPCFKIQIEQPDGLLSYSEDGWPPPEKSCWHLTAPKSASFPAVVNQLSAQFLSLRMCFSGCFRRKSCLVLRWKWIDQFVQDVRTENRQGNNFFIIESVLAFGFKRAVIVFCVFFSYSEKKMRSNIKFIKLDVCTLVGHQWWQLLKPILQKMQQMHNCTQCHAHHGHIERHKDGSRFKWTFPK